MQTFLQTSAGYKSGNILDVRPNQDFLRGHLPGATSHPLEPGTDLPSIFLPPRHEALLVVAGNLDWARALAKQLEGRGRVAVESLKWDQSACPADLLRTGSSTAHLWSAPDWLREYEAWLPPPAAGPVLDLACGSGRAMVWLAQKGYQSHGVDWQPEALELGKALADSRGVACKFSAGDLRDPEQVPAGPWSVILNFRFLQRDLLAAMPGMLQPGGVALIRTFRHINGYEGHPHRKHRLDGGELLRAFPAGLFDIIAHEEGFDSDGRPAAGIVARRTT